MKEVVSTSAVFFSYALLAIFAQNAVFTRALGVSRMVQLVGDDRTSSALFGMMLCITQVLVAPVAFLAGRFIAPLDNRAQLRPLVYIASIAVVCLAEHLVLWLLRSLPRRAQLLRIVPLAALNSGVLGTVLVERTQSFTLGESLGFGLGSGIGYVLAVLLVTEARHRLRSKAIPKAFRGRPSRWCISACWRWQSMALPDIPSSCNADREERIPWLSINVRRSSIITAAFTAGKCASSAASALRCW